MCEKIQLIRLCHVYRWFGLWCRHNRQSIVLSFGHCYSLVAAVTHLYNSENVHAPILLSSWDPLAFWHSMSQLKLMGYNSLICIRYTLIFDKVHNLQSSIILSPIVDQWVDTFFSSFAHKYNNYTALHFLHGPPPACLILNWKSDSEYYIYEDTQLL